MALYHIKMLLSRGVAAAVRSLLDRNKLQRPQIISDAIRDKQNTRYTHRFAPLMHVKTPAYIPWSQYDEIMKSMPDIDYLAQAGDIFLSAKSQIDKCGVMTEELKYYSKVAATNMVTCKLLSSRDIPKKVQVEYGSKVLPFPFLKLV